MQLTHRSLRPLAVAGVAMTMAFSLTARAAAEVTDFIPADALVVFKINNLQQVNQEAAALAREFGIAEMNPQAADPLQAFRQESGIQEGLNAEGNFAAYLVNGNFENEEEPPMVLLIPVSDYQAFLGNFEGVQQEQGVDRATLTNGDTAYFANWGDYAAMAPTAQHIQNQPEQTIELGGVTGERFNERDAIFYANFKQLGPMLLQRMQAEGVREQARQEFLAEFENAGPNAQKFRPVAEAAFDQFFSVAERFLNETEAAAFTIDLSDQGIATSGVAQFKEDSYFANLFGDLNATDDSLLSGLPSGQYIFFGGSVADQEAANQIFNDLFGPIVEQLRGVEGTEKFAQYIDAIKTQVTAAGDSRFGMFAPQGPLGGSSLFQQVVIQEGDAQQLLQAQREMAELGPEIMAEFTGGQQQEVDVNLNYQENATTVAGVQFDKLTTDFGGQQAQQMQMPMQMMFGPEGPTSLLGTVDGKLVVASGLSNQQLEGVVEAVRGGEDPLANNQGVQRVNEQLPDNRSAVLYFQADELVRSAVNLSRQMGFNMPVQLPEGLPPVGMSVGPAENSIEANAFISKDLVSALIVAAIQAQQQMQGGPGGPGGPGGGL